ncbi:MAG TPA: hypothetical protein VIM41_10245 [Gammaproteobacteria bacterium]
MFTIQDIPNVVGWLFGILPALGVMYWAWLSRGESWRLSVLCCGFLLVALGVWMAGLFIEIIDYIETLPAEKTGRDSVWAVLKNSSAIWLLFFPAAAGGVGVNLISAWLTTKKPSNG